MIITAVDNKQDLFLIENIFPDNLLDNLSKVILLDLPYKNEAWQEEYSRRRLEPNTVLLGFSKYIRHNLERLNESTGMQAIDCTTGFWLDEPGFTMNTHVDNSNVFASMQIYLLGENCPGTKFTTELGLERYCFNFSKNTGYLMINNIDQYHEVAGTVPADTYRLCSYTWFFPKL